MPPKKTADDRVLEDRVRAHVLHEMRVRGISPAEFSRRTGLDDGYVSAMLSGDRGIGLGTLRKICSALKITPTRILEEDPRQ